MNDVALKDFDALAIVEPYLYQDIETGEPNPGSYRQWQALMPTTRRQDGAIRHTYRSMLWVNSSNLARQVPVDSHDITAAIIRVQQERILVVSMYDPNCSRATSDRSAALAHKLEIVQEVVEQARAEGDPDMLILICTDLNRHNTVWTGREPIPGRQHEGDGILEFAQALQLDTLLEPGTITWEHQSLTASSTNDVIWGSAAVQDKMQKCRIYPTDYRSDHRAIEIVLQAQETETEPQKTRLELSKADWPAINACLQHIGQQTDTEETLAKIDTVAEDLVSAVQQAIQTGTPQARPSPYAKRWWNQDLTILRASMTSIRNAVTTARRRGQDTRNLQEQLQQARQLYFTEMDKQKRKH